MSGTHNQRNPPDCTPDIETDVKSVIGSTTSVGSHKNAAMRCVDLFTAVETFSNDKKTAISKIKPLSKDLDHAKQEIITILLQENRKIMRYKRLDFKLVKRRNRPPGPKGPAKRFAMRLAKCANSMDLSDGMQQQLVEMAFPTKNQPVPTDDIMHSLSIKRVKSEE